MLLARRVMALTLLIAQAAKILRLYTMANAYVSPLDMNRPLNEHSLPVCHSTCATCSGETSNQCLTCNEHYFLDQNQCIGITTRLLTPPVNSK